MINSNDNSIDPLKLRIQYLSDASFKLFNKIPSVSHYLMRCSIGYSNKFNKGIGDANVCKNCGVVLVPCCNLEVRCNKTNKRDRRKFKKYIKKKNQKGYYKNKMVYKCKVCSNVVNLTGVLKNNKIK